MAVFPCVTIQGAAIAKIFGGFLSLKRLVLLAATFCWWLPVDLTHGYRDFLSLFGGLERGPMDSDAERSYREFFLAPFCSLKRLNSHSVEFWLGLTVGLTHRYREFYCFSVVWIVVLWIPMQNGANANFCWLPFAL